MCGYAQQKKKMSIIKIDGVTYLALMLDREKTFMSSSGVGWVTVERMVPNAPLTDVIQFLFACCAWCVHGKGKEEKEE